MTVGHTDDWRPNAPADIDVVPEGLAGFARNLEDDLALFVWDQATAVNGAFDQDQVAFPSFAGAGLEGRTMGMPEGHAFQLDYGRAWAAMQWFLTEVQQGLLFLQQGAQGIHNAYGFTDALAQDDVGNAFARYQDVSVVQQAFGSPTQAPLDQGDQSEVDLSALEDQASEEFEQVLADREELAGTDDDTVSSWGAGDLDPRDSVIGVGQEGQPTELPVPADTENMDQFPPREHPAPNLAEADD